MPGFVARQALTGTKTDTPVIEIPQSVSVVTRDQIDARQAQTLGQALGYSAGVRIEQYGADWRFDWFRLRGFDAQTNSVYLDGLRYQFGSLVGMIEPYGLQRIEILRGPSSVLFGPNEPGGVVNLVQRRPTQTPQGEVRVQGFELEGVASLARGLSLIASYTTLDAETTKSNTPGEEGRRPSGIPNHEAALWLDYTFPEGSGRLAGLGFGGGVRQVGNTPAGNANLFLVPSVTLLDAALRYDLSHLSRDLKGLQLAVNARNLTDEQYVGRCDGAASCFYGFRRSVLGSVAYRW